MKRNPCENPDAGDEVVTPDGRRRVVTDRRGNDIYYVNKGHKINVCWISTWQEWCRKHDASPVVTDEGSTACHS